MQIRIFLIEVIFEALEAGEILEGQKCRKKSIELQIEGWEMEIWKRGS